MKIRSVCTIPNRDRFEHESKHVVLEVNGITFTITEHRERAGRIFILSSVFPMSVTPHGNHISIGVDQIEGGLLECDECGDLVSSVQEITSHNNEAPRFLCRGCVDDEPETDQPPPELSPRRRSARRA
jgi:hypothetical protein